MFHIQRKGFSKLAKHSVSTTNIGISNIGNLLYFYKKRIFVGSGFCVAFGIICKQNTNHKSEALRLGLAGAITNCICECSFHLIDTTNIRMKVVGDGGATKKSTY